MRLGLRAWVRASWLRAWVRAEGCCEDVEFGLARAWYCGGSATKRLWDLGIRD